MTTAAAEVKRLGSYVANGLLCVWAAIVLPCLLSTCSAERGDFGIVDTVAETVASPDAFEPDAFEPDVSAFDTAEPDVSASDTAEPDVSASDTAEPDVSASDTAEPDVSSTDVIGVDAALVSDGQVDAADQPLLDPASAGGSLQFELGGATPNGVQWLDWAATSATATAIFGAQGSHHIWVSLCLPSSVGTSVKVRLNLRIQGSKRQVLPGVTSLTTALKPLAGHPTQVCRLAIPAFIDCACTLDASALRLRAEIVQNQVVVGWREISIRLHVPTASPCPKQGKPPCTTQLP